jgi:hypothetical protein
MERLIIIAVVVLALAMTSAADAKRGHKHSKKAQVEKRWGSRHVEGRLVSPHFFTDCALDLDLPVPNCSLPPGFCIGEPGTPWCPVPPGLPPLPE